MFVQQVSESMGADDKLAKAKETMLEELAEKGIKVSDLEMTVLLESAIKGFKTTWNSTNESEQ